MKLHIAASDLTRSRFLGKFQELRASYLEAGMNFVDATNKAWKDANQ